MRLDNLVKKACVIAALFTASLLIVSCGGNTKKVASQPTQDTSLGLVSTEKYLPKESFDEQGGRLPYQKAVNPYNKAIDPIKKESIDLYIAARRAFKAKQYEKATDILEQLVKQDKSLSGPWVIMGDIARLKMDYGKAVSHYNAAIAINSTNTNAYLRLALVYRQQGEFVRSQNAYAKALDIWKDFPEAHLNLAILYDLYMDEPLKAQRHLEAYQFLIGKKTRKVAKWLEEIRARTQVSYSIEAGNPVAQAPSVGGGE